MGFNCGIVGLPNVGKSTLFNALTQTASAEAQNYPFCTIEPNTGRVGVPDERLDNIMAIAKSAKLIPTQLEFVDIAGLVRGASKGEGLGNQFLGNIREVDAIAHVLRCFEDSDVTHVDEHIDPVRDMETVNTELMLADLESLTRRHDAAIKKAKGGDKDAKAAVALMERLLPLLEDGNPARELSVSKEEEKLLRSMQLLTAKPVLYICNVDEDSAATGNDFSKAVEDAAKKEGAASVIVSAAIESEVAQLTDETERTEFLDALGLSETGLARVIRAGYGLLGLLTFFTVGPKETRAWTTCQDASAPEAAGVIHTDFQKGFICAETISYEDYIELGGEQAAKDAGKMRQEGKEYTMRDGDIVLFRFNV